MKILNEIVSELMRNVDAKEAATIPYGKVKKWMQNKDLEVLGAVYVLITEPQHYSRIKPYLTIYDYIPFLMHFFERCFLENPDGKWALTRYAAGRGLINLFIQLWNDPKTPHSIPLKLKEWLAKIYKQGNEDVRLCIITATLEHIFVNKKIATFFSDWRKDPFLKQPYEEALGYSKHFKER
jgi:hypothetical protein